MNQNYLFPLFFSLLALPVERKSPVDKTEKKSRCNISFICVDDLL